MQYPHTITNPHEGIARRLTSTILIKQSESEYGEDDRLAVSLAMVRNQQDHKLLEEFEQGFAKFVGTDYCLVTINRSSAISLALRSLGLEKRDEVIIPVCASTALLSGVMAIGALPRFVDVNREDGNIDASQLRFDDASKVKALVAVHTNGRSCKTQSLLELACKNGWQIIEDASEAIGSRCDGKHLGTSANLGLIGFQRFSPIGLDHGAVLVTSDKKVLDRLASERDRDLAPSEIQAALALSQLRKLRETIDRKRQLTRIYYELLDEAKLTALWRGRREGELLLNIDLQLPSQASPVAVRRALEKCGVDTALPPPPLHREFDSTSTSSFPNAEEYCSRGLLMPSSVNLEHDDISYVCEVLRLTLKSMFKTI